MNNISNDNMSQASRAPISSLLSPSGSPERDGSLQRHDTAGETQGVCCIQRNEGC